MSGDPETTTKKSFWHTLPGIITGIAGLITAATGLFLAINNSKTSAEKIQAREVVATDQKPEPEPESRTIVATDQKPQTAEHPVSEITVAAAEKITNDFMNAWKSKLVYKVMPFVSTPFLRNEKIETDMNELRQKFEEETKRNEPFPEIKSITVKTIKEWKSEGFFNHRDELFRSLNIGDDDFCAVVEIPIGGLPIYFRVVNNKLKIAGIAK